MADPIMDLFDESPLFNLDSLPEDTFSQGSSDPVEEALKLALGQEDPPLDLDSAPETSITAFSDSTQASFTTTTTTAISSVLSKTQPISQVPLSSAASVPISIQTVPQPTVSLASSTSGSTAVILSSPLAVSGSHVPQQLQPQHLLTQQAAGQVAPKIVILKSPQGQAQVLQSVTGNAGKLTIARVLTGAPVKPGLSIVSGGAVLNAPQSAQGQVKVGTGVQRLVQTPNGPVKQVLLTSLPQTHVQLPAQTQITQRQTEMPKLQLQTQVQPVQVQAQDQVVATTGSTVAAQTQGVTLSAVAQQV